MKHYPIFFILSILLSSCNGCKEKTKETINQGGEVVGKTATEFIEGISEGVDKTLQCEISLSQELKDKGLSTGTFSIQNDSAGGENNRLTLYIIFNKDFNADVSAKAFHKNGLEVGRTKTQISGKVSEANYFDFYFDKRTNIEVKSKITLE
jgi:hypothetical protein